MKLNRTAWTTFLLLSLISLAVWLKFAYPQLIIVNFSIDRNKAVAIAEDYLKNERHVDSENFKKAAAFHLDKNANKYLQKSIGFNGLKEFIKEHDFGMFFWAVRFFKENTKEEYLLEVDSATGEITGFNHTIDDGEARRKIEKPEAREKAKAFLKKKFNFTANDLFIYSDSELRRDNRSDFSFSWQKNNPGIPWSDEPNSGVGKLLINANISGDEVLSFSKNIFRVPDQFNRYLESQKEFSHNATVILKLFVLFLFTSGIFFILVRQNHLAMHTTKKFYIGIMLFSFALSLLTGLNQFENILFSYKTTLSLHTYIWRIGINTIVNAVFITVAILIPSLSGELLHYETAKEEKRGAFLHYIQSTFASRSVFELILLGYFVCIILLGIQSILIKIGQTYLGVWIEYKWIDNVSTAYLPFLAALTLGFKASFSEEIMYRLYAISLGRKIFSKLFPKGGGRNILIVVLISSLIWGFAHSNYPIFPMWFRGLEVTCLGIFLSVIYLRFGIIPVLVSHYLFDAFWNSAGYIFGATTPFYFYSSISILLLPLALGLIAFFMNRKEDERPLRWNLNKHQKYNLEILKTFLSTNKSTLERKSVDEIKTEIASHGWDPAVIEMATEDIQNETRE